MKRARSSMACCSPLKKGTPYALTLKDVETEINQVPQFHAIDRNGPIMEKPL